MKKLLSNKKIGEQKMRYKIIFVLFAFFLIGCIHLQKNSPDTSTSLFTKQWAYPDLPDSLINFSANDQYVAQACRILPPDSVQTFGNIRGMGCDKHDNLYVWDDGYLALWKFSPKGEKIWRKKFHKGNGERSFDSVRGAFAVSQSGQIAIGDFRSKSISILDSDGNFQNRFKVNMFPATITFGKDETIYVAGFEMSYRGPLIHHYSNSGEFLGSFCEREALFSRLVMMTGNSGRLAANTDGQIYYSFFYPYKINIFSPEGKLLRTLNRIVDNFQPPARKGNIVMGNSGLRGLLSFPNNVVGVAVILDKEKQDWGIDFFDAKGNWLKYVSKNSNDFPNQFSFRYWAADSKGNIYFDVFTRKEPAIVKYSINFDKIKSHNLTQ